MGKEGQLLEWEEELEEVDVHTGILPTWQDFILFIRFPLKKDQNFFQQWKWY